MKGDKFETTYFGTYVEQTLSPLPVAEYIGNVEVAEKNGVSAAFLRLPTSARFDLPQFMKKYANKKVALLARQYPKEVNSRIYNKLIVIAVRILTPRVPAAPFILRKPVTNPANRAKPRQFRDTGAYRR